MKKSLFIVLLGLFFWGCESQESNNVIKAYVTLQGADKVAVIDVDNQVLLKEVSVDMSDILDMPHFVVIDETHGYWYVTLISSGYVLKFDLKTDEMVDSVFIGNQPALMALDEERQLLYVSRFMPQGGMTATSSREIHQIDCTTMTIRGTVDVGASSPHGIALAPGGGTVWVSSNQASHFFRIDTSGFNQPNYQPEAFKIDQNVPTDYTINDALYNPLQVILDPTGSTLYVTCSRTGEVRAFETDTGVLLATYPVGNTPWHLAIDPGGDWLYVANRGSADVSRINLQTTATDSLVNDDFELLQGCALSADGSTLIVTAAGKDKIHFIDAAVFTLTTTISLEKDAMPTGVAIAEEAF